MGLDRDPVPGARLARGVVVEVGVDLELVDRRDDAGLGDDPVQVRGLEVRDAGAAQPPVGDEAR